MGARDYGDYIKGLESSVGSTLTPEQVSELEIIFNNVRGRLY